MSSPTSPPAPPNNTTSPPAPAHPATTPPPASQPPPSTTPPPVSSPPPPATPETPSTSPPSPSPPSRIPSPPSSTTPSPPSSTTQSPPSTGRSPPPPRGALSPPSSSTPSPPSDGGGGGGISTGVVVVIAVAAVEPAPTSPPSMESPSPSPPSTTPPSPSPPLPPSPSMESPSPSPPLPPFSTTPPSPSPPWPPFSTTPSPSPSSTTPSQPSTGISPPSEGGGGGGISTGAVVGISVAGVATLAMLSILFICYRKKKRRHHGPAEYYGPPPPGPKADPQSGPVYQWQQNALPPPDHVVTIPPKVPPPPGGVSRPPQSPVRAPSSQPPPPPGYISSSGGSGSNYSGSENPLTPPSPGMAFAFSKSTFTYEELSMATDGFSDSNLLGQGGFGYVHRGVLPNGKEVAVKQLKAGSGQGEREFQAEVEIISRVHHKHLVSLVGYCITGVQRMLVYEFVPNNTLEFHLHSKGRPPIDFSTRLRVALGSAKGLAYLHEDCHPKTIHRDIKASNILLDFNFEAKVADFGLAKITSDTNTHVSTRVMGTFGYLAPEYASSGKLTDKSDVFSFGVVLLELITGRRPVDSNNAFRDDSFVDWARPLLTRALDEGNFDSLVDTQIANDYNHNEMARMVACAAACVRHSARRRPRMSQARDVTPCDELEIEQVVRALEGDVSLSDLSEGVRPGHSTVYGSSEYSSGPTSEYVLYPSGSSSEGQTTREMEMGKMKKDDRGFNGGSQQKITSTDMPLPL